MGYIKPGKIQQEMDVLKFYLMDNGVLYVIEGSICKMLMLYADNLDFQVVSWLAVVNKQITYIL